MSIEVYYPISRPVARWWSAVVVSKYSPAVCSYTITTIEYDRLLV